MVLIFRQIMAGDSSSKTVEDALSSDLRAGKTMIIIAGFVTYGCGQFRVDRVTAADRRPVTRLSLGSPRKGRKDVY